MACLLNSRSGDASGRPCISPQRHKISEHLVRRMSHLEQERLSRRKLKWRVTSTHRPHMPCSGQVNEWREGLFSILKIAFKNAATETKVGGGAKWGRDRDSTPWGEGWFSGTVLEIPSYYGATDRPRKQDQIGWVTGPTSHGLWETGGNVKEDSYHKSVPRPVSWDRQASHGSQTFTFSTLGDSLLPTDSALALGPGEPASRQCAIRQGLSSPERARVMNLGRRLGWWLRSMPSPEDDRPSFPRRRSISKSVRIQKY